MLFNCFLNQNARAYRGSGALSFALRAARAAFFPFLGLSTDGTALENCAGPHVSSLSPRVRFLLLFLVVALSSFPAIVRGLPT